MSSELSAILPKLRESIPHELLGVRDIPGGGQWVYCPWRNRVKLLDLHTGGDWSVSFTDPQYLEPTGEYLNQDKKRLCVIRCTLTIRGVSRESVGTAVIQAISSSGKDSTQGDPVERARGNALTAATEMWGIGVYLHRQKADKGWQRELIRRVQTAKREADQNWIAA